MAYDQPALALEGAHIYVGERLLLPEVDLVVPMGSHLAISGASGSGKSVLLRVLAGFPPPSTGQLRVDGEVVSGENRHRLRRRLAYVPQTPRLPGATLVMEYLREPTRFHSNRGVHLNDLTLEAEAEELRLPSSLLLQRTDQLSGGEKHRLMLLRALLLNRQVFLLDEFSASLDPASRGAALETLRQRGSTIVSVSHDERWIEDAEYHYEIRAARLVGASREKVAQG
ncbi:MAG: ATP-binding cassette domain-containing protein [Spirochaetaceae bacterium]